MDTALEAQMRVIAEDVYNTKGTKFGVADVPTHGHNQIDSLQLPSMLSIPQTGDGVLSRSTLTGFVKGASSVAQTVYTTGTSTPGVSNTLTVSIPIIQGFGNTSRSNVTTGTPALGATSATLTGVFVGPTGRYATQWLLSDSGSNEIRYIQYTSGSTAITWTKALTVAAGTTQLTIIANSRFLGGTAPLGTSIGFVNGDNGIRQLWIRADVSNDGINGWYGFDFDQLCP